MDALDGSDAMLKKLQQKGIYRKTTQVNLAAEIFEWKIRQSNYSFCQAMLGNNNNNEFLPENQYDVGKMATFCYLTTS